MEKKWFSKDKILMGPEHRRVETDNKNKTITAYYESGDALIAYYTRDAMPFRKSYSHALRVSTWTCVPVA